MQRPAELAALSLLLTRMFRCGVLRVVCDVWRALLLTHAFSLPPSTQAFVSAGGCSAIVFLCQLCNRVCCAAAATIAASLLKQSSSRSCSALLKGSRPLLPSPHSPLPAPMFHAHPPPPLNSLLLLRPPPPSPQMRQPRHRRLGHSGLGRGLWGFVALLLCCFGALGFGLWALGFGPWGLVSSP